jgi:hypothetical protein
VLTGASFRDNSFLAEFLSQQDLADCVIDFVCPRVADTFQV